MESGYLGPNIRTLSWAGQDAGRPRSITRKFSAKKFFGTTALVGKSPYRGNTGADPTELAYFHVWTGPSPGGGDNPTITFIVVIDYIAVLTEPKLIPQS